MEAFTTVVAHPMIATALEPGSPWQNCFAESFNSRFRDEFLSLEEFDCLRTARELTSLQQTDYNHHRPHSALGDLTPIEFASQWPASVQSAALPSLQLGPCPAVV